MLTIQRERLKCHVAQESAPQIRPRTTRKALKKRLRVSDPKWHLIASCVLGVLGARMSGRYSLHLAMLPKQALWFPLKTSRNLNEPVLCGSIIWPTREISAYVCFLVSDRFGGLWKSSQVFHYENTAHAPIHDLIFISNNIWREISIRAVPRFLRFQELRIGSTFPRTRLRLPE